MPSEKALGLVENYAIDATTKYFLWFLIAENRHRHGIHTFKALGDHIKETLKHKPRSGIKQSVWDRDKEGFIKNIHLTVDITLQRFLCEMGITAEEYLKLKISF